jgi:secondary thiamine-phosphate synthase enzyme
MFFKYIIYSNVNILIEVVKEYQNMEFKVRTTKSQEFINITQIIKYAVKKSGINDGIVTVFIPHTTAGVTINENTDSDVVRDIIHTLNLAFPEEGDYKHGEGNSHAHIKACLTGTSCNLIVEDGELQIGTWQGVYFCEYDGPRTRRMYMKIIEG